MGIPLSSTLTPDVVAIYPTSMKTPRLLAENVRALLAREHQQQTDLAQWCRKSDVWVSQFLRGERNWRLEDLDRVADLWGLQAYQLFIPGIADRSERRSGTDRRTVKDRRIGHAARAIFRVADELDRTHHRRRISPHADVAATVTLDALKRLTAKYERDVAALLQATSDTRFEAPAVGEQKPSTRQNRGRTRGSDAEKA